MLLCATRLWRDKDVLRGKDCRVSGVVFAVVGGELMGGIDMARGTVALIGEEGTEAGVVGSRSRRQDSQEREGASGLLADWRTRSCPTKMTCR